MLQSLGQQVASLGQTMGVDQGQGRLQLQAAVIPGHLARRRFQGGRSFHLITKVSNVKPSGQQFDDVAYVKVTTANLE